MDLNEASYQDNEALTGVFVQPPPVHQGVADALRSVFMPTRLAIPEDMADLLSKLA